MEFLDYFRDSADHSDLMNFVRQEVLKAYPEAGERISYQLPCWTRKEDDKSLFYAMPAKKHLGFYPMPAYIQTHSSDLQHRQLKFSKGAVQIPYDYPQEKIAGLIADIISFNLKNL